MEDIPDKQPKHSAYGMTRIIQGQPIIHTQRSILRQCLSDIETYNNLNKFKPVSSKSIQDVSPKKIDNPKTEGSKRSQVVPKGPKIK